MLFGMFGALTSTHFSEVYNKNNGWVQYSDNKTSILCKISIYWIPEVFGVEVVVEAIKVVWSSKKWIDMTFHSKDPI